MHKNVIRKSACYCINVILLVYLHPKNVIYAKTKDRKHSYENILAEMLSKQGYDLYFYKRENPALEMDFFVRDATSLIPVEVKLGNTATASLNKLTNTEKDKYSDIKYGIKFCMGNVGFNGHFYTFPYFMAFLLKRCLREKAKK